MKRKLLSLIAVAAISASVLAACGNDSGSDSASDSSAASNGGATEITVDAHNFEFSPNEIKVKKGDKVKLTLKNTDGLHGLEIPDYDVNLQKDGTAEFTADKAGTFDFNCSVMCGAGHDNMTGTLIVEE